MTSPGEPDNPASKPFTKKPSRSGADVAREGSVIKLGGKVDPNALRKAMGLKTSTTNTPAEADETAGPVSLIPPDPDAAEVVASAEDDAPNRVVFVLQRDLQKRLDKYLTDRIPFMSRTQLQRLIDEGGVTVNTRPGKASTKLRVNDRVEVFVPPPPSSEVPPQDIPLDVLYEDQHLIVLNKHPNIIVHPARSHLSGTLINALAYHFQHRSPTGGGLSAVGKEFARPGVVHRLDRNTSGVIVFAKDDETHWRLGQQFENRSTDKRYLAIVHGLVEPAVDVIDLPLGPHPSKEKGYREKYVVRHDVLGKPSVTIARVRAHFGASRGGGSGSSSVGFDGPSDPRRGFSLVELELKTGRTHQIRVHLSHNGYPIVADEMYGGRFPTFADLGLANEPADAQVLSRVALHAATLSFTHPGTRERMNFTAPFPPDLWAMLDALRQMDSSAVALTPPGATVSLETIWV